jgi:taurine transport system permease protein
MSGAILDAPAPPARRRLRMTQGLLVINVAAVLAVLALWWAATGLGWVAPIFLPSPGDVLHAGRITLMQGELVTDVLVSARRVFLGFALAAIVAVPLGIVMGVWRPAKAVLDPFVSLLRPLPSITWIPLSILWLGIGELQKVAIVFMGSWIYILLYTFESTRRVDPLLVRAARNLGASDIAVMREVVLPGALPGIISGLKVTLAISWSCVLTAEMIAAQNGLGALIWQAKDWGNMPLVLVGMLCISLTVLVADWIVLRLEAALLPWERGRRG